MRAFLRGRRMDSEMSEEMLLHIEMQEAANRRKGMSADEARYLAQREFGNMEAVKETIREQRGSRWLEQLGKDFQFSFRSLAKSPGFTGSVVVTLAIGIGMTTAIVGIGRRVIFPRLPFPAPEQIVRVDDVSENGGLSFGMYTPRFAAYHDHSSSFSGLAMDSNEAMNLVVGGQPFGIYASWATEDFFQVYGIPPVLGRYFAKDEFKDESGSVAVLTERIWRERFGSDPTIVGRDILFGGKYRKVVGVSPERLREPVGFGADGIYLPTAMQREYPKDPARIFVMGAIGRLKPGVTREQAEAELAAAPMPDFGKPWISAMKFRPRLASLDKDRFGFLQTRMFGIFFGAVFLLYASACSNAANLILVRSLQRRKELGIRLALGGSRGQIVRLVVVESVILAAIAGTAGLLVAMWSWSAMMPLAPPTSWELESGFVASGEILVFALALSTVTCAVVSIVPALRIARLGVNETLKEASGALGDSRRLGRLRNGFMVLQSALAVILLLGAGLMTRSFHHLVDAGVGFDPANKVMIATTLPYGVSSDVCVQDSVRLIEQLERMPGVESVAQTSGQPLVAAVGSSVKREDHPEIGEVQSAASAISVDYFKLLGVPLISGRGLSGFRPGDPPVVVINEALARLCFGTESPIGKRLVCDGKGGWEVVGVVRNVRDGGTNYESPPHFYCPVWQLPEYASFMSIVVRLASPPGHEFESAVHRAAYTVDPRIVVAQMSALKEQAASNVFFQKSAFGLLGTLSTLAAALAALGLFAVMAYAVAQRGKEFGIRMALGATSEDLQWFVLRRGLFMAALGITIGLGASWALVRLLQSALFETSPHDPLTYCLVAIGLFAIAALACWMPARRASKIDPLLALRSE